MDIISQIKKMQQELNTSSHLYAISINAARQIASLCFTVESVKYRGSDVLFFVNNYLVDNTQAIELLGKVKEMILEEYRTGVITLYTLDQLIERYR